MKHIFYTECRAMGACGGIRDYRGMSLMDAIAKAPYHHLKWLVDNMGWKAFMPARGETEVEDVYRERLRSWLLGLPNTIGNWFKKRHEDRTTIVRLRNQLTKALIRR